MDPNKNQQPVQNINQPPQQISQQQSQQPEKPSGGFSKYKLSRLLIAIIVVLVAFSIVFGFLIFNNISKDNDTPKNIETSVSESTKLTVFQELIRNNCGEYEDLSEKYTDEGIAISDLPIIFDEDIIKINTDLPNDFIHCSGVRVGYSFIDFKFNLIGDQENNEYTFYIHDIYSEEPPSHRSEFGSNDGLFRDDEEVKMGLSFDTTLGGDLVEEISVSVTVKKKINLNNGEVIYVSFNHPLIQEGNDRLLNIINKYSVSIEAEEPEYKDYVVISDDGYKDAYNEIIINFIDIPDESVQKSMDQINTILSAITAK